MSSKPVPAFNRLLPRELANCLLKSLHAIRMAKSISAWREAKNETDDPFLARVQELQSQRQSFITLTTQSVLTYTEASSAFGRLEDAFEEAWRSTRGLPVIHTMIGRNLLKNLTGVDVDTSESVEQQWEIAFDVTAPIVQAIDTKLRAAVAVVERMASDTILEESEPIREFGPLPRQDWCRIFGKAGTWTWKKLKDLKTSGQARKHDGTHGWSVRDTALEESEKQTATQLIKERSKT